MDFYKNRKVLITGHTGFKGGWLSVWLKHIGADILGYSTEPPTEPSFFEAVGIKGKIQHVIGDIRDEAKLTDVFHNFSDNFLQNPLNPLSYLAYLHKREVLILVYVLFSIFVNPFYIN